MWNDVNVEFSWHFAQKIWINQEFVIFIFSFCHQGTTKSKPINYVRWNRFNCSHDELRWQKWQFGSLYTNAMQAYVLANDRNHRHYLSNRSSFMNSLETSHLQSIFFFYNPTFWLCRLTKKNNNNNKRIE